MKKRIALLLLIIFSFLTYRYVFKDHRIIENETAEFIVSATDIAQEFSINPINAETKYLNKTIEVTGVISEFSPLQITLNEKVFCQFDNKITSNKINQKTTVKGRFIGFDSLLEEIKLDKCHIIN